MPAGPRIRSNSEFGLITDNPLTAGATTFNSARLSLMPVVSSAHAVVTLDPRALNGEPEIVIITAHTAAATVATISRAAYGTVARSHPSGTEWIHAPIDEDFVEVLTSSTRPSDPYRGQTIFETDTNAFYGRSTADAWQNVSMFADPPSCRVFHSVNQSTTTAVEFVMLFNSESWDTASMHSTVTLSERITIPVAGLYHVYCSLSYTSNATGNRYTSIKKNGSIYIVEDVRAAASGITTIVPLSYVDKAAAGDYYTVQAYQTSGGALNVLGNGFGATWIGRG